MSIDPTRPVDIRAGSAERAAELAATEQQKSAPSRARADQVEISEEARSLAEQGAVDRVPFTEARAEEIRGRLSSGFYEQSEIIQQIAEKLVDSGDL